MMKKLNNSAIRELLERRHFAHIGCVLENGKPYVVPINYLYNGDSIYLHSLPGQKLDALRKNENACIQVEEIRSPYKWSSAIAFGEFEEVTDEERKGEMMERLLEHFYTLTPVEGMATDRVTIDRIAVFRIKIKELTGVCEQ